MYEMRKEIVVMRLTTQKDRESLSFLRFYVLTLDIVKHMVRHTQGLLCNIMLIRKYHKRIMMTMYNCTLHNVQANQQNNHKYRTTNIKPMTKTIRMHIF